jgi:TatD DNase family protein
MIFVDTHTHLYSEEFDRDRDHVVQSAVDHGVRYMFLPAIDRKYFPRMMELCKNHPDFCFPMIGLHPTSVKADYREELDFVTGKLENSGEKFYGIGEVGMDLYWDKTFAVQQSDALKVQADLAIRYRLPLVIHTRNSFPEVIGIMEEKRDPALTGVFHCFGGSVQQAKQAIELGFFLGIGGIITYKNSGLQEVVGEISLDHLLLETDSPWLTPVPFRGQRNESSNIPVIAEKIAEIRNISVEEVARITTENALRMFNISR